jgi:hypothetical protein
MNNQEQILKETIGIELFINMDSNLKLLIYEAMKVHTHDELTECYNEVPTTILADKIKAFELKIPN